MVRHATCLFSVLAVGCATPPPTEPRTDLYHWLTIEPRTLAVEVAAEHPAPIQMLVVTDTRTGERVGAAALAGTSAAVWTAVSIGDCSSRAARGGSGNSNSLGGVFAGGAVLFALAGCPAGVVVSPFVFLVTAGATASGIEPREKSKPVAVTKLGALFTPSGRRIELPEMLARAIGAEAAKQRRHKLVPLPVGEKVPAGKDARLRIVITSLELVGYAGTGDPNLYWNIGTSAWIDVPGVTKGEVHWYQATRHGQKVLLIEQWGADDALALREEFEVAAQAIAASVVNSLTVRPSRKNP